jgi:hypothetical protein
MMIFWCSSCNARVQMIRVDTHLRHVPPENGNNELYAFGHCPECERPAILSAEEVGHEQYSEFEQIYPVPQAGVVWNLPKKVDESYREALRCSAAGAHIATAVMVRRTLEAIAREFSPNARTLAQGLKAMHEQGVISNELSHWGDELRFLGNIGAHPTEVEVTGLDAEEAVEFLDAIVETLFHLRPKFQAMRARRVKATGGNSEPG